MTRLAEPDTVRSDAPAGPGGGSTAGLATGLTTGPTRYLRVVPTLFVLLFVSVIALAVSPGLRHQLTQSFVKQDQHYLELYFTDEVTARTCPVTDGALQVDAAVRSHLDDDRRVDWTATAGNSSSNGTLDTVPGKQSRFLVRLDGFTPPATVTVRLAGRSEQLTLHCT